MIKHIELEKLHHSNRNVRRSGSKVDAPLKASIAAHGLLQNLAVIEGKEKGHYQVIAGGRRLAALLELQAEKKLPADFTVACIVLPAAAAEQASLAENTVRQAMHPADEFEAFAGLVDAGMQPIEISNRYGVSEKHVLQRLKLGKVHPEILKAFRADKIDLRAMQAFTITDDQAKQLKVFKACGKSPREWQVKDQLTDKMVRPTNEVAKYVGLEAYEKAGGLVARDLFGDNDYIADVTLLHKLAHQKLAPAVAKLKAEGWGWVEIDLVHRGDAPQGMRRYTAKTKADKAAGGAIIGIGYWSGKVETMRGLLKPGQKAPGEKAGKADAAAPVKKKPELSAALVEDLERARWAVAFESLAHKPSIAVDLFAFQIGARALRDKYGPGCDEPFGMRDSEWNRQRSPDSDAAIERVKKSLDVSWLKPKTEGEKFEAFTALPHDKKQAIMAFALALTLDERIDDAKRKAEAYEIALGRTGVNVAEHWRPTAEQYLKRSSIDQLLKIGKAVFGSKWQPKAANRSYLANSLGVSFANPQETAGGDKDLLERLTSWLPAGMAFRVEHAAAKAAKKRAA